MTNDMYLIHSEHPPSEPEAPRFGQSPLMLPGGSLSERRVDHFPSGAPSSPAVDTVITPTGPRVAPLLSPDLSRFFAERCYLAQWTLGRLLEIYQQRG
jgi:hypothetical protein